MRELTICEAHQAELMTKDLTRKIQAKLESALSCGALNDSLSIPLVMYVVWQSAIEGWSSKRDWNKDMKNLYKCI